MVAELMENGEYFQLIAPMAFKVKGKNTGVFLKACAIVQMHTKLIQFEYDEDDGEVRPVIEFPLEDNTLSYKQFMRCVTGMVQLLDQYYPVLQKAAVEGVIDTALYPSRASHLIVLIGQLLEGAGDSDKKRLEQMLQEATSSDDDEGKPPDIF